MEDSKKNSSIRMVFILAAFVTIVFTPLAFFYGCDQKEKPKFENHGDQNVIFDKNEGEMKIEFNSSNEDDIKSPDNKDTVK